ncbi:MAG: helix-turn-helix domain-containing protein [Clostridia bacterium]|nr:helix-turn-helix domain-containing protein [Clostridia bacterium]
MANKKSPMLHLKMKRIEKGLTQEELAKKVGVIKLTISNYETGTRFPRKPILDKLAAVLECQIADLI